jgi:4-hydroxybutyrate CoA-transferase
MPATLDLNDFAKLLKPGMTVFVQGAASEPTELVAALARESSACEGIRFISMLLPGVNRRDYSALGPNASATYFFVTPDIAPAIASGRARLLPLQYSQIISYLQSGTKIDLALIQASPPDTHGRCRLGLSVDFVPAVVDVATTVIAEINHAAPFPTDSATIAFDRIHYILPTSHVLIPYSASGDSSEADAIATAVATLIEDGDVIQIGIGKVPNAVLKSLGRKRDLGIHSGMITDPIMSLMKSGVITGVRKSIDRNKVVTGLALGSQELYDFSAQRDDVAFRPVDYTHNVGIIAQIDNFVAVNSAIEVDLFGQVNSEGIGGRQFAGIGGLADFARGAQLSRGGRSIFALAATSNRGTNSRIVPTFGPHQAATISRSDTDFVVTEFGVADLRRRSADERAQALIAVAAPSFRKSLEDAWDRTRRAQFEIAGRT